jgi:hypothetical protein
MSQARIGTSPRGVTRRVQPRALLITLAFAAALGFSACAGSSGGGPSSALPSEAIPTFPPDDLATGPGSCIDEPTTALLDQLRAPDADVPALLEANRAALIVGLSAYKPGDPNTVAWRDMLITALRTNDLVGAAAQLERLGNDEVTITPC